MGTSVIDASRFVERVFSWLSQRYCLSPWPRKIPPLAMRLLVNLAKVSRRHSTPPTAKGALLISSLSITCRYDEGPFGWRLRD